MLSQDTRHLLYFLSEKDKESKKDKVKPKVGIQTTVGFFAFVYEKVRNFVDYQEERLLLRRAITRILLRRAKTGPSLTDLTEGLVAELLMARYLDNNSVSQEKLSGVREVLGKYFLLYQNLGRQKLGDGERLLEFLLSLSAREIEENLTFSLEDQLLSFVLKKMEQRVEWYADRQKKESEEEKRTRLLVGLMRALTKYDERTIYYKLFKLYFPFWKKADDKGVLEVAKNFSEADKIIRSFLEEKCGEPLVRFLKKQTAPFEILGDLLNREYAEVENVFSSPESLAKAAFAAANARYEKARSSLRRSAVNSFIYIFITKMLFALAIEVPYELYIANHVNPLPILVNLFFPPGLMIFMALTVEPPTADNTQKIVDEILSMTFGENNLDKTRIDFNKKSSLFMTYLFRILYALAFLFTFGISLYILRKLHFSIVSLGIFFFFLSTISFFAFRIRSAFKELVVGEEGANLVSNIFDFFMLPFIRLGRAISTGLSEINVFTFFLDIILEAPFKMVLEILEEWTRFLREKKEETLNVIK